MKDFAKAPKSGSRPPVRQVKGPGMNLGLKKPRRKPAEPKDYSTPRPASKGPAFNGSYLPDSLGLGRKKSKP